MPNQFLFVFQAEITGRGTGSDPAGIDLTSASATLDGDELAFWRRAGEKLLACLDELPLAREDGPLARIVVPVPEGENYILLRFEDTPVRTVGKAVTAVGLLALLAVAAAGIVFWRWQGLDGSPTSLEKLDF